MDIVTLGAALNGSAEYVNSHFKGGSNIQIVNNPDGTQTINASGEVSSEDTVARAEIAAIKDGTNINSFGDVESALGNKADSSTTYTKTEVDTALSGKQATLTTAQLAAANSGITSADVAQITTNKNNILSIQQDAEVQNARVGEQFVDVYNFDYGWESGSIDTSGNEVSGDRNNFRTKTLSYFAMKGKTISVMYQSRYIAVAYYNGNTFISRTAFVADSITVPADNTYNIRIVISNKNYIEGDTLANVLKGVVLPEVGSLEPLSTNVSDLILAVHGITTEITYTDGVINNIGEVSTTPTTIGNCMSSLIKKDEFESITIEVDESCLSNYCLYNNGTFVSRSSWKHEKNVIENTGYDVVILFASRSIERTKEQVLTLCNASIYKSNIDTDIAELKSFIPNIAFLNKIMYCDTGRNIIHYSIDDVWISLYDIITHTYESVFDNSFFGALKTLHDTYGICVTLNTFNSFSKTPAYDISDLPNTYQAELQENKNWLRFAFHAESDQSNYNTSTGISAAYDKFVAAIYNFTGDYDCIDTITRLGFFGGSLENVLAIKNKQHGIIGLLCADATNRDSYYLNTEQNKVVQSKGKYYDLTNELIMLKTINRTLTNAPTEIESNPCYQKYVEIFCHEYESSAPNVFESVAQYASTKGYLNAFPSDILN